MCGTVRTRRAKIKKQEKKTKQNEDLVDPEKHIIPKMWRSTLGMDYIRDDIRQNQDTFVASLRHLQTLSENQHCADCGRRDVIEEEEEHLAWTSVHWGVFLCPTCAHHHQTTLAPTQISCPKRIPRNKGTTTTTTTTTSNQHHDDNDDDNDDNDNDPSFVLWGPDEVIRMQAIGNARASRMYGGDDHRPSHLASDADWQQFIRDKYQYGIFMPKDPSPSVAAKKRAVLTSSFFLKHHNQQEQEQEQEQQEQEQEQQQQQQEQQDKEEETKPKTLLQKEQVQEEEILLLDLNWEPQQQNVPFLEDEEPLHLMSSTTSFLPRDAAPSTISTFEATTTTLPIIMTLPEKLGLPSDTTPSTQSLSTTTDPNHPSLIDGDLLLESSSSWSSSDDHPPNKQETPTNPFSMGPKQEDTSTNPTTHTTNTPPTSTSEKDDFFARFLMPCITPQDQDDFFSQFVISCTDEQPQNR